MSIEARNIDKWFGEFHALKNVSARAETGELLALLGPSGSGKTTLLRVLAGLEFPECGTVLFDEGDATAKRIHDRRVGFVFQHYALFRHMTVFENVAFGMRVQPRRERPSDAEITRHVNELLHLVQLAGMGSRYPAQLSGGQRQRVALARALAVNPKVLLLDEPFGSLDAKVRKDLRRWLRTLHDELHFTSIFVTHDQEEALEIADRVVVMNEGTVEQVGTPEEIYSNPANSFVCQFIGDVNLFHGRIEDGKVHVCGITLDMPEHAAVGPALAMLCVRPHSMEIHHEANGGDQFRARVTHISAAHAVVRVELLSEWGDSLHVELAPERYHGLQLEKGSMVFVRPKESKCFVASATEGPDFHQPPAAA